MISCKRATELISKKMDEPLSFSEGAALAIHLFICEFCEKFKQQVDIIGRALSSVRDEADSPEHRARKAAAKERVRKNLQDSLGEN